MAKVECMVDYTEEENEEGFVNDCVMVECGECGHETQSWGHGKPSVKRCLALLREECPDGESNFYVDGDD